MLKHNRRIASMQAFVIRVIEKYPRYLQEEAIFERRLEIRENRDMRDALTMLRIKLRLVESWFALLDADECFALRLVLRPDLNDVPAFRAATTMWLWQLIKEGKASWILRERAIEKITAFALDHRDIMMAAFADAR